VPSGGGQGQRWGNAWLGLSTQFVVGPAGESDRELLATVQLLYRDVHLSRTYYSAFRPVARTPLEGEPPTSPLREHRLYQADWLMRFYDFSADELPFDPVGQLRTDIDPKTAWARAHPERFPIEVNRAPLGQLLRIPGIGPHLARIMRLAAWLCVNRGLRGWRGADQAAVCVAQRQTAAVSTTLANGRGGAACIPLAGRFRAATQGQVQEPPNLDLTGAPAPSISCTL
jgi:hypothetical protein